MTEAETKTDTSPESTGSPEANQTGLTIQDLSLVLQVINLTASRGAFKADELTTVGGLHDRILRFLDSVGATAKNSNSAVEEVSPPAPVEPQ